mmetsp:Transcript_39993/g.113083  ORF Transcript_39993/g.113083 Transcript_39993/m.113083 type:complete len:215 (-) Transcript_39993:51-695(-)
MTISPHAMQAPALHASLLTKPFRGAQDSRRDDLPARDAGAGVARLLAHEAVLGRAGLVRLGVVARAEVILVLVDHDGPADDCVLAVQLDEVVGHLALGRPALVHGDVAHVAHVAVIVGGGAVALVEGVVVGARAGAALAEVRLLVDVEAVRAGLAGPGDVPADLARVRVHLLEGDRAAAHVAGVGAAAAGLAAGADVADGPDGELHGEERSSGR